MRHKVTKKYVRIKTLWSIFWQFDVAFIVHVLVDYLVDVGEGEGTL